MGIEKLTTEKRNPNSMSIDQMDCLNIVKVINDEDKKVAEAVEKELPKIAEAIETASNRFKMGGRLIYIGAGTSGRLGTLDAIELTPTYSVPPTRAFGILAGGDKAMYAAVEGAEDSEALAVQDLTNVNLNSKDIVVAIAASGRTPYTISAIDFGKKVGALTISVTCTENNMMTKIADIGIAPIVGPEVITGSTRMKAGSAQKMVLNMLSTGIMIKTGKVYQNLMVNVQPTNEKLVERSIRIISEATNLTIAESSDLFQAANNEVNVAIVMHLYDLDQGSAVEYLKTHDNMIVK